MADGAGPYWLCGNLAPAESEATVTRLDVDGSIPIELCRAYARNGPNPCAGRSGRWLLGDGMVHGVALPGGKAPSHRNRWMRTPRLDAAVRTSPFDVRHSLATTNVIQHAGRVFALVENAFAMEIGRDPETLGLHTFGGGLVTDFKAHPKIFPETGELHFIGYGMKPPSLTYQVANRDGSLVRSAEISMRAATMAHDLALTRKHVVFLDLPIDIDWREAQRGSMPCSWRDQRRSRLGIVPRDANIEALRGVEIEPSHAYHRANAYDDANGDVVIDVAWHGGRWRGGLSDHVFEPARLRGWRLAVDRSSVTETLLDDRAIEFPRVNDRVDGHPHRFVWAVETGGEPWTGRHRRVLKYAFERGTAIAHAFDGGTPSSEFAHVAPPGASNEDGGWLMGFVVEARWVATDLVVLAAQTQDAAPMARVKRPVREPLGLHGNWLPDFAPLKTHIRRVSP